MSLGLKIFTDEDGQKYILFKSKRSDGMKLAFEGIGVSIPEEAENLKLLWEKQILSGST